jgi:HK97 family phage portal protein
VSLFARRGLGDTPNNLIPTRLAQRSGLVVVTPDSSLKSSAVWAAQRLRADLVSTMPIDVYRRVQGLQVNVPTPPVLVNPGGEDVGIQEWLYATQFELDRTGNAFGIISERDGLGLPRRIDLVESRLVVVTVQKDTGTVTYRIDGKNYNKSDIWHERQFVVPGLVMGLSPVGYAAAYAVGQQQSAAEFALEWFGNGGQIPSGHFRNTARTLAPLEADNIKTRFKAAINQRDVLITGSDWEYSTMNTAQNESQFLETQHASNSDIARFYGVPGDLLDIASMSKSAVTYQSITQRNLEFLIHHLGPVFARREVALSKWLAAPRYVKFNTDALLRMDPQSRTSMMLAQVAGKIRTPSEVREMDNLAPFTDTQIQELEMLGIVPEYIEPMPDTTTEIAE